MKRKRATLSPEKPAAGRMGFVALVAVALSACGAAVMSAKHIWAITLPGCGQGGGCEWATIGPYSKVFGFPIAFLGLGYFVASLCNLALTRSTFPDRIVIWIVRLGAVASLVFVGIMLANGKICLWCATTHVGNLIYWAVCEQMGRGGSTSRQPGFRNLLIATLAGLLVIIALQMSRTRVESIQEAENYRKGMESVEKIGADTLEAANSTPAEKTPVTGQSPRSEKTPPSPSVQRRFGGRYWEGNPDAPVRIVVFHDYQCELCRKVETTIAQLMATRSDVAFSVKQWPFDAGCNRFILGTNMHPGACEAAKVAEAAGLAGGEKAFWGIHHWLVAQGGQFSQTQLRTRLDELGVDPDAFGQAFNDQIADSLVLADIEEGMAFGLTFTPLIFVNGYRVDGWQSVGVLPAAIERAAQVAKTHPKRNDRPDLALDIQYQNWLATPPTEIGLRADELSRGPENAAATVLVYGDLTCAFHASAQVLLDRALKVVPNVRYIFRDFPLDANCNELVTQQINPRACEVARWALAVRKLAGDSSCWRARDWIVRSRDHLETVTVENLSQLAGVSRDDILRVANSPEIEGALRQNLTMAIQMGVNMSPTIYVNGKLVAGWRTPGVLTRVISKSAGVGE